MSIGSARWAVNLAAAATFAVPSFASAEPLPLTPEIREEMAGLQQRKSSICGGPDRVDGKAFGSYFRKVESVPDQKTIGISAEVTLPEIAFDEERQLTVPEDHRHFERSGPLDRPSVYIGMRAEGAQPAQTVEIDAGLQWTRVYDSQKRPTVIFAFQPFLRANDGRWVAPMKGHGFQYHPGQTVTMSLAIGADNQLDLHVVLKRPDDVDLHYAVSVPVRGGLRADGSGPVRSFKRINAIDQRFMYGGETPLSTERRGVVATKSKALMTVWRKVSLLGPGSESPMTGSKCRVVIGAQPEACKPNKVTVSEPTAHGGETVDIDPSAF